MIVEIESSNESLFRYGINYYIEGRGWQREIVLASPRLLGQSHGSADDNEARITLYISAHIPTAANLPKVQNSLKYGCWQESRKKEKKKLF